MPRARREDAPLVFGMLRRYISLTPSTKALSLRERLG